MCVWVSKCSGSISSQSSPLTHGCVNLPRCFGSLFPQLFPAEHAVLTSAEQECVVVVAANGTGTFCFVSNSSSWAGLSLANLSFLCLLCLFSLNSVDS